MRGLQNFQTTFFRPIFNPITHLENVEFTSGKVSGICWMVKNMAIKEGLRSHAILIWSKSNLKILPAPISPF